MFMALSHWFESQLRRKCVSVATIYGFSPGVYVPLWAQRHRDNIN